MAYKAKQENKENKETKGSSRIDVECNKLSYNDITLTKISFYPINKKGLLAKCQVVLNDTLVLDEILISENAAYVNTPSRSYEVNGERKFSDLYFFITKGKPKEFSDFIIEQYWAGVDKK